MAKRIQYRAQLAFKPASEEHMRVYQYLRGLPEKTDYIVRLVLADLNGENEPEGGVASRPERIDYGALVEMLRPTLAGMVREAMRDIVPVGAGAHASPSPGASAAPPPPPPPDSEDIDLALEGLKAFGI